MSQPSEIRLPEDNQATTDFYPHTGPLDRKPRRRDHALTRRRTKRPRNHRGEMPSPSSIGVPRLGMSVGTGDLVTVAGAAISGGLNGNDTERAIRFSGFSGTAKSNDAIRPCARGGLSFYTDGNHALTASFINAPVGISAISLASDVDHVFADVAAGAPTFIESGSTLGASCQELISSNTRQHGLSVKSTVAF